MPVIGFLSPATADDLHADRVDTFRQGLGDAGFVEGQNVTIEYRWADNQNKQLPVLAADLVRRQVAVIAVPLSTPGALAAKAATTTNSSRVLRRVGPGRARTCRQPLMHRPGGNLTGVTSLSVQVGAKRLELVHELLPQVHIIALLVNPTSPLAQTEIKDEQAAAEKLGLELHVLQASTERDFDEVFADVAKLHAGALVIGPDSLFTSRQKDLAAMALRHSVPAIYQFHAFAAAGGLMSYGASLSDYHQLGSFYRPDSQGREAGRSAGPAIHQGPAYDQPQDRQRTRSYRAAHAAGPCRRGDRMTSDDFGQWSIAALTTPACRVRRAGHADRADW